jgi:hypothetical protein
VAKSGSATFDSLIFTASPGEKLVPFSLNSDAIDMEIMRRANGNDFKLNDVLVSFRHCKPGEMIQGNT